jgi:hypothetical protein
MVMTAKEKKAFVARMKKGKKNAAKVTSNLSKSWGVSNRSIIAWLRKTIKTRMKNPKNYSSDYSRGELRGYKEALAQLTGKPTRFGR